MSYDSKQERDPDGSESRDANRRKRSRQVQEEMYGPHMGAYYPPQAPMPGFYGFNHDQFGIMPYNAGQFQYGPPQGTLQGRPQPAFGTPPIFAPPPVLGPTQAHDRAYYMQPIGGQDQRPMLESRRRSRAMPADFSYAIPYPAQADPRTRSIHSKHGLPRAERPVRRESPIDNMSGEGKTGIMNGGETILLKKIQHNSSAETALLDGILGYKGRKGNNK